MKQGQFRKPLVFVAVVLLLGVLAACGGGTTEPAAPAEPATAVAPAVAPTEPPVESEPITETEITETEPVTASEEVTEPASSEITATESISESAAVTESAAASETSGGAQTFAIDPTQSQARFLIDEVLRGNPVTVEGITSLISGELTVDAANPAASTIGTITIDANDLATPEGMRNRAIRNFILQTGSYQHITFQPTGVEGLPASVQVGDSFSFTVMGDLQIRDVVNPAVFTVEVTADSAAQISGVATSTIARADYGLTIPDVPFVADVGDEVSLELQFTAVAQ